MRKYIASLNRASKSTLGFVGRPAATATLTALALSYGVPQVSMWITGNPIVIPVAVTIGMSVVTVVLVEGTFYFFGRDSGKDAAAKVANELKKMAARAAKDDEFKKELFEGLKGQGFDARTIEGVMSAMAKASTENTKDAKEAKEAKAA
jgi:low affinity Fe/Cu permease